MGVCFVVLFGREESIWPYSRDRELKVQGPNPALDISIPSALTALCFLAFFFSYLTQQSTLAAAEVLSYVTLYMPKASRIQKTWSIREEFYCCSVYTGKG